MLLIVHLVLVTHKVESVKKVVAPVHLFLLKSSSAIIVIFHFLPEAPDVLEAKPEEVEEAGAGAH